MRIILFANSDWYLYNFRLALAQALRAAGHELVLLSPPGEWGIRLCDAGFDWRPVPLSRRGMNPLREARMVRYLARFYREWRPDLTHHFTIKSVIYGSLAARLAGSPAVVNSITGLGHMVLSSKPLPRAMRPLIFALYRLALRNTWVVFQNRDNQALFEQRGLLRNTKGIRLIQGSGVDLTAFKPQHVPRSDPSIILVTGRLLWAKGISDVVEAARFVRLHYSNVEFWIVGERDEGTPDCIAQTKIDRWKQEPGIRFLGHRTDIAELNAIASIAVLASREGEGLPRSLLEAGASARPAVATDVPGNRDVVVDRQTGYLVPPRQPEALAAALSRLLNNRSQAREFGLCARDHVANNFSDGRVIEDTLSLYEEALRGHCQ